MIILDISKPFQSKPGFHKAPLGNKTNYRVWWLWFAITFCNMSDYEYCERIASGQTLWINKDKERNA